MMEWEWDEDESTYVIHEPPKKEFSFRRYMRATLMVMFAIACASAMAGVAYLVIQDDRKLSRERDQEFISFCESLDAEANLDREVCIKDQEIVYQEVNE